MMSSRPVMWFEPAPPRERWESIIPRMEYDSWDPQEAAALVETIKEAGNDDLRKGSNYEALWKYTHAVKVCKDCGLVSEMATIQGNCAQACLNIGLYVQAYDHAQNHVELNPGSPKAYYRRAEAVRRAVEILELEAPMVPGLPFTYAIPDAIIDYWKCHQIEQNSKALCEAIILAVDFQLTDLLKNICISSDVCPKLFSELVRKQNVKQEYIRFLISRQQFDASGIELSTLLHSTVLDRALMERMFELGMTVKESNIHEAVKTLYDKDEHIMDVILSKYGDKDPRSLDQPCKEALNAKKHKLASCLKKHDAKCEDPKELVDKIKQEGNDFFKKKQYDDALGKYFHALRICREHQFNGEMALICGNCAQACLKLKLYDDAYNHADECVRLDPKLHKGYYRRAEALKLMLSSSTFDWIARRVPPGKDFSSVVEDYCHCHRIKPNAVDVLCEAVVIAVDHSCTDLLPALQDMELTTQLLQELLSKPETTQKHIQCIILPKGASKPQFNGTSVNLSDVLKKGVTDVNVLERLFQMGMDVTEGDVQLAVECLPDTRVDILKLIISKYDEVSIACLNKMCKLAMNVKKMKFIACFIEHGAKPPRDELKRLIEWPGKEIDLVFAKYISSTSQETSPKPNQPTPLPSTGPEVTFPSADLQEHVKKRNVEGNLCFKNKDYDGAFKEYMSALELCRPYGAHMREEMAIIHGNTARVLLELRVYDIAFQHATAQLQFDPNSDKGFYRRAEALKHALLCRYMQHPGLTFANVISDLRQCHQIKPNLKALSEAIILAVDYGFISVVLARPPVVTESDVKSGFCVKLFRQILSREDVQLKHLDFLIFQLFDRITAPFNASSIKLSQLLEKSIVGMKFLRRMFELGMIANAEDVEMAVRILPDSSVGTLELIVSKQSEAGNLDLLLEAAVKARKMRFIAWLIEHGTKTPDELAVFLTQALDQKDFDTAKVFLKASTTITCKNIDLGIHIAAGLTDPDLIERLIDAGADPSGNVKKTLVEVLKIVNLPAKKQIDLVCLFLMKGADCNHLSLVRKTTTPLHVATELALEAGGDHDTRIVEAVLASPTFKYEKKFNEKGQTPYHVVVKSQAKRDSKCNVLTALSKTKVINPSVADKSKKRAIDYLHKSDREYTILEEASAHFSAVRKAKYKKKALQNDEHPNLESCQTTCSPPPKDTQPYPDASAENVQTSCPPLKDTQPGPDASAENAQTTCSPLKDTQPGPDASAENAQTTCPPQKDTQPGPDAENVQTTCSPPPKGTQPGPDAKNAQTTCSPPKNDTQDDIQPQNSDDGSVQITCSPPEQCKAPLREGCSGKEGPQQSEILCSEGAGKHSLTQKLPDHEYERLSYHAKLEAQLKRILMESPDYFQSSTKIPHDSRNLPDESPEQNEVSNETTASNMPAPTVALPYQNDPQKDVCGREKDSVNQSFNQYGKRFEDLPWEVEIHASVLKYFKDVKRNVYVHRLSALRTIYRLAEGRRSDKLSKQVGSELYEARIDEARRILWQKAISFSDRQTDSQSQPILVQVIRICAIVTDHDDIDSCIRKIEASHRRGVGTISHLSLLPLEKNSTESGSAQPVRGREILDSPRMFVLLNDSKSCEDHRFIPATSMKEKEYNIAPLYSISTALVKSILTSKIGRYDFPFKEWPKEHDIIRLNKCESILLLGRSGTGKTTCCLYRLWNEFRNYWDPELRHPDLRIPRKALHSPDVEEETAEDNGSFNKLSQPSDPPNSMVSSSIDPPQTQMTAQAHEQVTSNHLQPPVATRVRDDHDAGSHCGNSTEGSTSAIENTEPVSEEVLEDLHQVFITKNYVLCSQMKRRFYDMMASHDFLAKHMEFEMEKLPNTLTEVNDHAFPLFLTAREFYILLDNSLGDKDEDKFFRRDSEGNLRGKIVSSDYDHEDPDTLLDLDETDSESEDDEQGRDDTPLQQSASSKPKEKWVEVTSLYFKEEVWPEISHKCNLKDFDPLLFWMEIQSFIKGSETALRKDGPLSLEEYRNVGDKLAPNFSDYRTEIYEIYNQYEIYCQNQRHTNSLFDECDLIQHLHRRMHKVHDVPWSVHCFYIDEVQDFTQAELALFLQCCRDPNSTFFTGDTAQSIMRGISFRFQDLRSLFHRINKKVPQVKVPCKPHTLTVNFRSHSGILRLAQSILELLWEFFPGSIDYIPEDKGMLPGPTPVLLESCNKDDLAFLLGTNKREKSAIEFGAHQVILVRSKEAKDKLPSILKGAIVLTIFESKGLEFDDVLLYNFFTDPVVDEKVWRETKRYFEGHEAAVQNATRLPGSKDDPRGVIFNEGRHKSLNAELKYLYTAVTRAKCNLWIYNSDKNVPVFDYWQKRGLIKVVGTEQGQGQHSFIFASISTGEQWKVQGNYFMNKHLWEQAMHCYQKAGPDSVHLVKKAEAHSLWHQASHSKPEIFFLIAALCFLESDQLSHDTRLLINGAVCLMNARHARHYTNAAKLYELLGKDNRAFKAYEKARDFESCARLREKEGRFNDAVRILDQANKKREALSKAAEYERRDIQLEQELSTNELSYKYAKRYLRLKDTSRESESTLLEMLEYMNDIPRKIGFLKEGEMFEDAYDAHVKQKQHREAYRLASARGWFDRGKSLARQQKDPKMEVQFILQQIKAEWNRPDQQSQIREELHSLIKSTDHQIKAFACLLLGILKKDIVLCRTASETYKFRRNEVGEIEAFHAIAQVEESERKESLQSVLRACHTAQDAGKMLRLDPDKNPSAKQVQLHAAEFYGLQKIGDVYFMAPHQDIWIGKLLEQCVCEDGRTDLDGMLRLSVLNTREEISKRYNSLVSKWVQDYQLQQKLEKMLKSFKLHKDISENRFLSRVFSTAEVSRGELKDYIQNCIHFLELGQLDPRVPYKDKIILLLSIFSPEVSIYLPLSNMHIQPVRKSNAAKAAVQEWIELTVQRLGKEMGRVDLWLKSWRACCIADGSISSLKASLEEWAKKVCKDAKAHAPGYQPPPGLVFSKSKNEYYHLFSFWLRSCELIRDGQVVDASEHAIIHFLCSIATSEATSISVMNFVDVLSVHCMALLAMLALLDSPYCQFQVPMLYKHCVQIFDDLNASSKGEWLFAACAKEVKQKARTMHYANRLRSQCLNMLWLALNLLLGYYVHGFSVLSYAMKQEKSLLSGASRNCLVLAVTLLGNLMVTHSCPLQTLKRYQEKFSYILERSLQSQGASKHAYIKDALKTFRSQDFIFSTIEVFSLLHRLLQNGDRHATLAKLKVQQNGNVDFWELRPTRRKIKPLQQLQAPPQPPSSLYSEPTGGTMDEISPQAIMPGSKDLQDVSYPHFSPGGVDIQPVPSHPYRAVLSSQAGQPQPPSQTVSQTPSDKNMPILAVQPKDADLSSPLQRANTDFQSHTELETPPSADAESSGVTYQRQTSETELMRMESDAGDFLEPEAQLEEVGKKTYSKQVETFEHEAVDSNFCIACGVGVRLATPADQEESETPPETEVDDSIETRDFHVSSEAHNRKFILYKQFKSDCRWLYYPLKKELSGKLKKYQSVSNASLLDRIIDKITEVIEESEKEIERLQDAAEWQEGSEKISEISDQMNALLVQSEKEYAKVVNTHPMEVKEKGTEILESDHEELAEDDQVQPRTLEEKARSRRKKKQKKR